MNFFYNNVVVSGIVDKTNCYTQKALKMNKSKQSSLRMQQQRMRSLSKQNSQFTEEEVISNNANERMTDTNASVHNKQGEGEALAINMESSEVDISNNITQIKNDTTEAATETTTSSVISSSPATETNNNESSNNASSNTKSSNLSLTRSRTNSKVKLLVRSQAIRESASPPREPSGGAPLSPINNAQNSENNSFNNNKVLIQTNGENISEMGPEIPTIVHDSNMSERNSTIRENESVIIENNEDEEEKENADEDDDEFEMEVPTTMVTVSPNRTDSNWCDQDYNCTNKKSGEVYEQNVNNNNSGHNNNNNNISHHNTLTVNRVNNRNKLKHQNSSSFDSISASPCLSRESSTEYTDTTGINLTQFILETLNKNAKDRMLMLQIEQELVMLAKDKTKNYHRFPQMSSYQRMLVHRCAAFFGMDHNIEPSGKSVVVNKTKNTRLPDLRFRDHIRDDLLFPEEPRRSILKRDSNSFEECFKSPDRQMNMENRRSKSFEEREEEYEKVRRRIFNREHRLNEYNSQDEIWSEVPWTTPETDHMSRARLLHPEHTYRPTKLLKGQSVEIKDPSRPCVSKSYSFGGYTSSVSLLARGDSVTSTQSAGGRLFSKQDSATSSNLSWRLSPSSSGYKSQSQRSDSVTPSPTATPYPAGQQPSSTDEATNHSSWEEHTPPNQQSSTVINNQQQPQMIPLPDRSCPPPMHPQPFWSPYHPPPGHMEVAWHPAGSYPPLPEGTDVQISGPRPMDARYVNTNEHNTVMWAVTDLHSVPKGSILIDPQTGQPFMNPDGSVYHYDPARPPTSLEMYSNPPCNQQNNQSPPNQVCSPPQNQQNMHITTSQQNTNSTKPNGNKSSQRSVKQSSTTTVETYQTSSKQYSQNADSPNNNYANVQSYSHGGNNSNSKPPVSANQKLAQTNSKSQQVTTPPPVKQTTSVPTTKPETSQSPKKSQKYQKAATKPSKSTYTNTATSPNLPFTPPTQSVYNSSTPSYQYGQYENVTNMPLQPYYPNGAPAGVFGPPNMVPIHNPQMQIYNEETQMIYNYGGPMMNQYNRMDPNVSDLSGYFVNLNIAGDPQNSTQIAYQSSTPYWGQQPMVYYVPPTNGQTQQRYSVPFISGQTGGYIPAYPPQSNGNSTYPTTMTPNASQAPPGNTELVPVYPTGPPPIVYGPAPPVVPNGNPVPIVNHPPPQQQYMYATSSHHPPNAIMYSSNAPPPPQMYAAPPGIVYTTSNTTTNASNYSTSTTPNSCNTSSTKTNSSNADSKASVNSSRYTCVKYTTPSATSSSKPSARNTPNNSITHSNGSSSGSSGSPANTVVHTYYQQPHSAGAGAMSNSNRNFSPADTPPNAAMPAVPNYGYSYPPNYASMPPGPPLPPQPTMIYRNSMQMGVRNSPPVNSHVSRSPTPSAEHYDRSNRYSISSVMYPNIPCVPPGDIRCQQRHPPPSFRNTYHRPPSYVQQNNNEHSFGRPPKVKKPRSKGVPSLPTSGK